MIEKVCAVVFDEFCCSTYFKIENSFIGKVLMNWMHSAFDTIYAKHPNVFNFIGLKLTFILGLSSFGPRMKRAYKNFLIRDKQEYCGGQYLTRTYTCCTLFAKTIVVYKRRLLITLFFHPNIDNDRMTSK